MNRIRSFGLVVLIAGFTIFLTSFFLESYILSENAVDSVVTDQELSSLLKSELHPIGEKVFSTSFAFVHRISRGIDNVNEKQLQKFAIKDEELEEIIALNSDLTFSINTLEKVFSDNSEEDIFKRESLRSYGAWLDGVNFNNSESLKKQLAIVASKVEKYEILNKKGFNRYVQKDLKYVLAKASSTGPVSSNPHIYILLTYGFCIVGALLFFLPGVRELPGIKNNNIFRKSITGRGWLGILIGTFLILFYIILYFFPEYLTSWIIMVDPLSFALKGSEAGRFFLYGLMYTLAIVVMGVRMMIKYRGKRYQQIRTISVMFFQTAFAFLIPEILLRLNKPYFDFKNIWPLDYDFFFDSSLNELIQGGAIGIFMLGWGIALIVIAVPVLVYFFGKRWYCSWVCGCGGLAETLGDPFRQLSDNSLKAWKIERWMVHVVLVFVVVMTAGVLYTYWTGSSSIAGLNTYTLRESYGFWIGATFAGIVGVGFYPLMGNRVWCRFGCPLAAYLGMVQRFKSRFRITTNGGQCISCGNCSTYCEMGIDVRWYAQRGQNIIRSSCVGCGICSEVCPRGVLKLENTDEKNRFEIPEIPGNNSFKLAN